MLAHAVAALLVAAPAASAPGRYAEVDDVRLYYEVTGSGPPLLVLHGGGGSSRSFTENIASLSRQYTVIAPDSRGHGRSTDSAKPLTYARMAEDMAELLTQLEVGPVFVLGWSDGGNMGLHLAVHHPKLVRKLVVFGANTRVTGLTASSLAWVKSAGPGSLGKAREAYEKMAPDPKHWPVFAQKLTDLWRDMPDVTPELARIKAPTLIAIGDRDMISIEHATEMYRAIPGAQLFVAPGSTHSVLRERPALTQEVIRAFFAEEKR